MNWPELVISVATLLGVILGYVHNRSVQKKIHTAVNTNYQKMLKEVRILRKKLEEERKK